MATNRSPSFRVVLEEKLLTEIEICENRGSQPAFANFMKYLRIMSLHFILLCSIHY